MIKMQPETSAPKTRLMVTGANTLVGAEIVRQLSARSGVESVLLTMSAEEIRHGDFERLQAYLGSDLPAMRIVSANLQQPRFGLAKTQWQELATSFDIGFHCAQRETQDQNLLSARKANLAPLDAWIDLLKINSDLRLHHLSTAFIAGTRNGLLTEFDLSLGQHFHNAWERSKFEAEVRLRESAVSDQITIVRPSHILGHGRTGDAFEFGGAYPLIATLAAASILPADSRARIDLVPADYVATAMVGLAGLKRAGTFHLACGWRGSPEVRSLTTIAGKARGHSRGARLVPRGLAWPMRAFGNASLGGLTDRRLAFINARDHLHQGAVFDTYLADLALKPLGIDQPATEDWLAQVVRSAHEQHWRSPSVNGLAQASTTASLHQGAIEFDK